MYVNRQGMLVLMLVLVCGICSIPTQADHKSDRYAGFLLRDYRETPTKQMSEKLVQLLDQQQVSPVLGNQILQELTMPIVRTRTSYRVGKPAYFSLTRRFRIHFRHMSIPRKERIKTANDSHGGGARGGNGLDEKTRYHKIWPIPTTPGVYTMQAEYEYALIPARIRIQLKWPSEGSFPKNLLPTRHGYQWNDPNDPPVYQCKFSVPIELNVVPEKEAEMVMQVSNPHLDKRVNAVFAVQPNPIRYGYGMKPSTWKSSGGIQIHYTKSPVDAAFIMLYRFENGQEKIIKRDILIRRETIGVIDVEHYEIRIEQPGEHKGTVILRSDLETAYMDPEIQMIWSGELAFPMTHTVTKAIE